METKELTPEKSLEIISDAITKGRREFERNSGTPMIFWGCIVLVFSIVIWMILKQTENPLWNFLWFGVPVIGWPLSLICIKDTGIKGAKNFINETVKQVWTGYGIFATAIAAIQGCMAPQYIAPVIIAMLGYGTFLTGTILKNRYIVAGGLITGIGGTYSLLVFNTYDATLIFTAAAIVSLIIPGIMMNRKANKN